MKKKMLSLALALIMCLGLTVPAFAASQKTVSVQYADAKDNSGLTVSSSRTAPAGEEENASLRLESDGLTETGAFYEAWGDDLTGPYPVYASASPVKVTLTEGCTKEETLQYIAGGEFEGGVSTLCVDKVTYNEADKSITVLQENAAFFEGMIYFDGKNPCTIREYYSQDEDTHEEYFWSAPSIEIGSSVTLSQPGTYRVSESWSNAYGSTQALIVISESQPTAPGGVDLSGNKYLKVSKNPISWVHVVGTDGLGNDCDIVVLLLADDTTVNITIPKGQESKGHFNFWGVAEASGDGANELESFSETAHSDGKYLYEFQDESLAYITESYASHLTGKGYKVEKISAEEAARLLSQAEKPTDPDPADPVVEVEDIPASGTAIASTQTVTVDGKAVEFQMYALKDANGNLTNYIKLRDMAYVLNGTKAQFSVGYDGAISLATGKAYEAGGTEMTTPYSGDRAYTGGSQTVKIDGEDVAMTAITLTDDNGGGYNYFKLRDLGKALGFNVGYSNENGVFIESDKPYAG